MSQRDVPGSTRAIIPHLVKHGIRALSEGVNGASAPPALPKAYTWYDPTSGQSIIGMQHPGGYGGIDVSDCVTVQGWDQALCMAFNGDNQGPQTLEQALQIYAQLRSEFPNADVFASTFDQFVEQLETVADQLPVIDLEVGDTWIYGVPSDPLKVMQFRETMSLRAECYASGECSDDGNFALQPC
jgi:hypothetical protein